MGLSPRVKVSPCPDSTIGDTFLRNSARLAEASIASRVILVFRSSHLEVLLTQQVWMDDYKRYFYEASIAGESQGTACGCSFDCFHAIVADLE